MSKYHIVWICLFFIVQSVDMVLKKDSVAVDMCIDKYLAKGMVSLPFTEDEEQS